MNDVVVEATGETVGEAKWAALRELERLVPGLDRDAVRFEVVTEGERGLLGVGYTPAKVVAAAAAGDVPAPLPPREDEPDDESAVRELLERVATAIGASCTVTATEREGDLVATLGGADLGLLIGRHGQTIDALQYLANALARRRGSDRRVVVDAAGYRARRETALHALAQRSAERASATGAPVALEPMTAVERKVVHEFLKEDPEVETTSEGSEPNRYVVVLPLRTAD
ncbi:MAG TPA: RNA-binding cell elongation regulator Jag/EloR [Gaiellaceae bacterium]|nr:RNA-binding cell elongation regulator Jag/EloR [Gaiellaceae bacterium]